MLVLSEASDQLEPSASARDIKASTEAARLMGCSVYHIPQDFKRCGDAENALSHVPAQRREVQGVWLGYIPAFERYQAVYEAALNKNIRLLNNPEQHLLVQEFDRAYTLLRGLTPESRIVTSLEQCREAAEQMGLPLFVKGAVQSLKSHGWDACVASTPEELQRLTAYLLRSGERARGRVVVRRVVRLRHTRTSPQGFPLGREYRVFVYRQRVVVWGYYWEGEDDLKALTAGERDEMLGMATAAAKRLGVPYVAVDVGQTEGGEWVVIETGDPQFAGVSQISLFQMWSELRKLGSEKPDAI
jgi:ATP-grasp domain, R2K clade family 3